MEKDGEGREKGERREERREGEGGEKGERRSVNTKALTLFRSWLGRRMERPSPWMEKRMEKRRGKTPTWLERRMEKRMERRMGRRVGGTRVGVG
jgi:hypothetical protein